MFGISAGHGVKHFGQGALLVMAPTIRAVLGLSDIAYGGIFTVQAISAGVANVPAGILADVYRKRVAMLLTVSMLMVGLGYAIIGLSFWYGVLLIGVVLVGFGTSLWHAPAFGSLAARYPSQRGLALAAHLTGAQIGNTISPIIIGLLLSGIMLGVWYFEGLSWRWIAVGLFIPMSMVAVGVAVFFRSAAAQAKPNTPFREYIRGAKRMLGNRTVLGLAFIAGCRGAVHTSFQSFVVLYMREQLGYSAFQVGAHVALLTLAGIVSTPIMGWLSDRIGRKWVIVTAMGLMTTLLLGFLVFNTGIGFAIMLGLLGLFFFSVVPVITAATIDQLDPGSEASATALIFTGIAVLGALSSLVAGFINQEFGFSWVVVFTTCIAAVATILGIFLRIREKPRVRD